MGSCTLIIMFGSNHSDALGVFDDDSDSISSQNMSLLTAVLEVLIVCTIETF